MVIYGKIKLLGGVGMNKEIEEIIVKTFFIKKIQQRVLFELSSNKKRRDRIARIESPLECFRKEFIYEIPKPNSDFEEIEKLLKKQGAGNMCYVMTSIISDMDGKELPLKEALENLIGCGMPFLISCAPDKLAYFQGEQGYGPPRRFILKKK
jgi:hypothetical protein